MVNTSVRQSAQSQSLSLPAFLLRLEGLVVFVSAVALYIQRGESGVLFALLILAPDLSALGYAVNVRVGSVVYNAVHTYALPLALGVLALLTGWSAGIPIALIWLAHIGGDRALGFGLKYPTVFNDTHLQHV
jgi:hypothetical protein